MSLVEWNPFRDLDTMQQDMDNSFNYPFKFMNAMSTPKIDVFETDKDVVVNAEMAGMSKDDINIFIDENSVKLQGEIKRDNEIRQDRVFRTERYYGSFSRSITLPSQVNVSQATAKYTDGILTITAPKINNTTNKSRKLDINQ